MELRLFVEPTRAFGPYAQEVKSVLHVSPSQWWPERAAVGIWDAKFDLAALCHLTREDAVLLVAHLVEQFDLQAEELAPPTTEEGA
jgi:hypothetical protein